MSFNNEWRQLADWAYTGGAPIESDWRPVVQSTDTGSGYQGTLYYDSKTGRYCMASRGTQAVDAPIAEKIADITADLAMGLEQLPQQLIDAEAFYQDVRDYVQQHGAIASEVHLVGHSLGGAAAMYLGAKYGNPTDTFNAYGVGNLPGMGHYRSNIPNITNHVIWSDPVSSLPGSRFLGKTLAYGEQVSGVALYSPLAGR